MVFFPLYYGEGSIELFKKDKAAHFMGQGQPGEGKKFMGPVQDGF